MLTEDVFESGDLELLSEEEVMEINGGCGSVGPAPDWKALYHEERKSNQKSQLKDDFASGVGGTTESVRDFMNAFGLD